MGKSRSLHEWRFSPKEAVELQERLRPKVIARGAVRPLRWIAGVDVAYKDGGARARAAVVVCRWPEMEVLEWLRQAIVAAHTGEAPARPHAPTAPEMDDINMLFQESVAGS